MFVSESDQTKSHGKTREKKDNPFLLHLGLVPGTHLSGRSPRVSARAGGLWASASQCEDRPRAGDITCKIRGLRGGIRDGGDGEGPAGLPGPGDSRVTREYRGGRTNPAGP